MRLINKVKIKEGLMQKTMKDSGGKKDMSQ